VVIQELRAAMSRPVKSSHTLLKKVAFPSRLETRIITGAVLARFRKFSSLSRSAISRRFRCSGLLKGQAQRKDQADSMLWRSQRRPQLNRNLESLRNQPEIDRVLRQFGSSSQP